MKNKKTQGFIISNPNNKELFNKYLLEIAKFRPLPREEELALFKLVEKEDTQAIDKLCKHNLLFVVSIAKTYASLLGTSKALTLEDLVNEGNLGLYIAIRKFDSTTGNKFISYAVWWIRQHILKSIQDNIKSIRIPPNVRTIFNKITSKESNLEQILGRTPSTLEIFESMLTDNDADIKEDDTVKKIDEIVKMNRFELRLSALVHKEDTTELAETIIDEDALADELMITKERREFALRMLEPVNIIDKEFLNYYFGLNGHTKMLIKEMSVKYDISPSRIKFRITRELRRMRSKNRSNFKYFFPEPDYVHNRQWRNGRINDEIKIW
jgi:RNA polymerase primary sigma factor